MNYLNLEHTCSKFFASMGAESYNYYGTDLGLASTYTETVGYELCKILFNFTTNLKKCKFFLKSI